MIEHQKQQIPKQTGIIKLKGKYSWDAKIIEITHFKNEIFVHYENDTMKDQEWPLALYACEPGNKKEVDWAERYLTTLFFLDGAPSIISYWTSVK